MSQRMSGGWTTYILLILLAIMGTIHSWVAGSPYFGNEFRTVELLKVWSVTDDEKTTWQAEYVDQITGLTFEHDIKPRAAAEFQKAGSKATTLPILLEIGAVDPIAKERHDHFYIYRWVATSALVVLLFWWLFVRCPEFFWIFAIFSD